MGTAACTQIAAGTQRAGGAHLAKAMWGVATGLKITCEKGCNDGDVAAQRRLWIRVCQSTQIRYHAH